MLKNELLDARSVTQDIRIPHAVRRWIQAAENSSHIKKVTCRSPFAADLTDVVGLRDSCAARHSFQVVRFVMHLFILLSSIRRWAGSEDVSTIEILLQL